MQWRWIVEVYRFNYSSLNWWHLQSYGDADLSGEELHDILKEIDTNMNGQVELDEYLQVNLIKSWVHEDIKSI